MKSLLFALFLSFSSLVVLAQEKAPAPATAAPDPKKETLLVEASCGQCNFKLSGQGCDLAVRINGTAYFADGSDIDSHGDAHAKDGFCSAVRQAKVQGQLVDNRFKATYFQLAPEDPKQKKK